MLKGPNNLITLLICILIIIPACTVKERRIEHSTPMAVVKVRVVADENYVKSHIGHFSVGNDWEKTTKKRVMDLSRFFEKEFAIKLEILSLDIWEHGHNVSDYLPTYARVARTLLFESLRGLPLNNSDLIIGISINDIGGMVEYKGKYMLIGTPGKFRKNKRGGRGLRGRFDCVSDTKYLDRHELGHIFGLDDKDYGPGSIMKPDSRKTEFNELEKSIIMENKGERFGIYSK